MKMEPKVEKLKNSLTDIPNSILKDFYGSKENSKKYIFRIDLKIEILFRVLISPLKRNMKVCMPRLSYVLNMCLPFFGVKLRYIFELLTLFLFGFKRYEHH